MKESSHDELKIMPGGSGLQSIDLMDSETGNQVPDEYESRALAHLGVHEDKRVLRKITPLAIIAIGFVICDSPAAVAATLAIGISQGGTVTVIYGIFIVLFFLGCSAATMAELASVYPSAGGQYHWTSILAPPEVRRQLSYCCGAINILGWISIVCSVAIILPQLLLAIVVFFDETFVPHPWHYFLIYQACNIVGTLYNTFVMTKTPRIHDVGLITALTSFTVVIITCLAQSTHKQPSSFVWGTFINESGWSSDSIVFLTGMVTPNYIYGGLDGAIHMAEEALNATWAVPWALMSTIIVGFISAFAFTLAMIYSMSDFNAVLSTATGVPIYEIYYQATRSEAAATVFMATLIACVCFSMLGCQQTTSRLMWSYARDNALIFSKVFGHIHPGLHVPIWCLCAQAFVVFIMGCIYLGSSTAFNAFIGTGLVLQQLSFAFPAALLIYRRRANHFLPHQRPFRLGPFGWVANISTLLFTVLILVFYNLPVVYPPTGSTMNYTSAVLGTMAIFVAANWFLHARKNYMGPALPANVPHVSQRI